MARGRGFEFGDASTDKIILLAGLGLFAWFLVKAGAGLNSLFKGAGDLAGATGNVGSAVAGAVNGITNTAGEIKGNLQQGGQSVHDWATNNTPNAVPDPGFGPMDDSGYMISPPLDPSAPAMAPTAPNWAGPNYQRQDPSQQVYPNLDSGVVT